MPPTRTQTSKPHRTKTYKETTQKNDGVPGVQKIKAAIRQTTRLLAKVCIPYYASLFLC